MYKQNLTTALLFVFAGCTVAFADTPAQPTGISATGTNAAVSVSWAPDGQSTSYNIYRSTSSGGEGASPYRTGLNSVPFVDTSVSNGTTYYYQISAVNDSGEGTRSTEVSAVPSSQTVSTNLTKAQAIQIATNYCTALGLTVNGNAAAVYPAPSITVNGEREYWQPAWQVTFGDTSSTNIVVQVVDATGVVDWFINA